MIHKWIVGASWVNGHSLGSITTAVTWANSNRLGKTLAQKKKKKKKEKKEKRKYVNF